MEFYMKLIGIGNNLSDIRKLREFAKKHNYPLQCYSTESWQEKNVFSDSALTHPAIFRNIFQSMDEIKIRAIQNALLIARGNATRAAKILKMSRASVYRMSQQYGIKINSMRYDEEQGGVATSLKKSA